MIRLNKIAVCISLTLAFQCHANWYTQNTDAWLQTFENTERARERAIQDSVSKNEQSKPKIKSAFPVNGIITSQYGSRHHPILDETKHHNGIDIAAKRGSPITSLWSGVVVRATFSPSFGNVVEVDHGGGKLTRYAHADSLNVSVGDHVKHGDYLGAVGSTGLATGPHLHFELIDNGRRVDPMLAHQVMENIAVERKSLVAKVSAPKRTNIISKPVRTADLIKVETNPIQVTAAIIDRPPTLETVTTISAKSKVSSDIENSTESFKISDLSKSTLMHTDTIGVSNSQSVPETNINNATLKTIKMADSDSLWVLAKQIRGNNSIYQALLAIHKLNPGVFIRDNINLRRSGVDIIIPDESFIAVMSRKEGLAKIALDNNSIKKSKLAFA